jgi:copper(I)-binding protein
MQNRGGRSDTLAGVTSPGAHHVMLMATTGGRMTDLAVLPIPPGRTVAMVPGAVHLMLEGVSADLGVGDSLQLVLHFSNAGEILVAVPVVRYGEMPE